MKVLFQKSQLYYLNPYEIEGFHPPTIHKQRFKLLGKALRLLHRFS